MVLSVSPKVGPTNNCPMLDIYDVVPRVRRIKKDRTYLGANILLPDNYALTRSGKNSFKKYRSLTTNKMGSINFAP